MYTIYVVLVFFFKQKTAYEMRISDWSSDVCSSDLDVEAHGAGDGVGDDQRRRRQERLLCVRMNAAIEVAIARQHGGRIQVAVDDFQIGRASCRERVCQYV